MLVYSFMGGRSLCLLSFILFDFISSATWNRDVAGRLRAFSSLFKHPISIRISSSSVWITVKVSLSVFWGLKWWKLDIFSLLSAIRYPCMSVTALFLLIYFFFLFLTFYSFFLMCMCVHMCHGGWGSKDNLQKLILSFYHVGSGDQTEVVRLGSKYLACWVLLLVLTYFFLISTLLPLLPRSDMGVSDLKIITVFMSSEKF